MKLDISFLSIALNVLLTFIVLFDRFFNNNYYEKREVEEKLDLKLNKVDCTKDRIEKKLDECVTSTACGKEHVLRDAIVNEIRIDIKELRAELRSVVTMYHEKLEDVVTVLRNIKL